MKLAALPEPAQGGLRLARAPVACKPNFGWSDPSSTPADCKRTWPDTPACINAAARPSPAAVEPRPSTLTAISVAKVIRPRGTAQPPPHAATCCDIARRLRLAAGQAPLCTQPSNVDECTLAAMVAPTFAVSSGKWAARRRTCLPKNPHQTPLPRRTDA